MFGRVILVVEAVNHREVRSCLIDGEVVCCDEKGGAAFQLLRHRRNEPRAFLYVFDLLELNGTGLRREPIEVRKATAGEHPAREPASLPRLFALRLGPLDHVDMPAVDALKQQDRWESVVEPGQLPGELHARRATTTDQPRLWLVIHVRIIGVRECRHGTGNIVRRASVEATSVVGDRARVRRFRRIRSLRISGRPAQTAAALAGACGQAASHPRIGGTGVPTPGLSEQASN